jgi:hypothetical protein
MASTEITTTLGFISVTEERSHTLSLQVPLYWKLRETIYCFHQITRAEFIMMTITVTTMFLQANSDCVLICK